MGMLLCVWPALNPLSILVTFTAIVPEVYPCKRGQNVQKCAKMANFWTYGLNYWEIWLKLDGYMLRCVWQALNPLFIHVTFTAIVPGAYPGRPKCALGWLQKLTHVPLAIAILLVDYNSGLVNFYTFCTSGKRKEYSTQELIKFIISF